MRADNLLKWHTLEKLNFQVSLLLQLGPQAYLGSVGILAKGPETGESKCCQEDVRETRTWQNRPLPIPVQ